jgi:saccharopepsin
MTTDYDAVLGLAPSNDFSPAGVANPFGDMVAQGLLDRSIVSISLGRTILDRSYPGEITYGGINEDKYHGNLRYVPLLNATDPDHGSRDSCEEDPPLLNGTWRVEARAMSWGKSPTEHQSLTGFTARFDTAEPYIYLPQDIWRRLNTIIDPANIPWVVETIDCERRDLLPDLTFQLGDHSFTITAYEYMLEVLMGVYGWRCMNGIQPWDKQTEDEKDMIVLGSPFLRGFYSVFDFDQKHLGCKLRQHSEFCPPFVHYFITKNLYTGFED